MPTFLTRHSDDFSLTSGTIDWDRSTFAKSLSDYPEKVKRLASVVGTTQFLWAVEASRGFEYYEMCKPVEWKLNVSVDRVLGYVDDQSWCDFIYGKSCFSPNCFSTTRPHGNEFSVLLHFPLRQNEVIHKRAFQIQNPREAHVVHEEAL